MQPIRPLEDLYIRLAAVEIRYSNATDYATAITDSATAQEPGISIMNGQGRSFENGETELRIVLAVPAGDKTLSLCYWQVPGKSAFELTKIYKNYTKPGNGYDGVKSPFSEAGIIGNNDLATVRCILRPADTSSDTLIGLLVNPPFPHGWGNRHRFFGKRRRFRPLELMAGLMLGAALPSLLKLFGKRRR